MNDSAKQVTLINQKKNKNAKSKTIQIIHEYRLIVFN